MACISWDTKINQSIWRCFCRIIIIIILHKKTGVFHVLRLRWLLQTQNEAKQQTKPILPSSEAPQQHQEEHQQRLKQNLSHLQPEKLKESKNKLIILFMFKWIFQLNYVTAVALMSHRPTINEKNAFLIVHCTVRMSVN